MDIFKKEFNRVLSEQEEAEVMSTPEADDAAMAQGLDDGTDPESFNDVPGNPMNDLMQSEEDSTIEKLAEWIDTTAGFIEFLNGTDNNSMNSQLNQPNCNSILQDVRRSESKKVSRLAQDLSSLEESLKQYLLQSRNKFKENQRV